MNANLNDINKQLSILPVQVAQPTSTAVLPQWIRLPVKGLCPFSGLSRSKLYQILNEGRVKNVSLRPKHAVRGVRLIHLPSLMSYLESQIQNAVEE